MEESGIVGFTVTGAVEKVTDFRTAPFRLASSSD